MSSIFHFMFLMAKAHKKEDFRDGERKKSGELGLMKLSKTQERWGRENVLYCAFSNKPATTSQINLSWLFHTLGVDYWGLGQHKSIPAPSMTSYSELQFVSDMIRSKVTIPERENAVLHIIQHSGFSLLNENMFLICIGVCQDEIKWW